MAAYGRLAEVYDWLVPDALLSPEGSAEAFAGPLAGLDPGARVLDCAAGTGQLAVGLALRGFSVAATDASAAMIDRTRALASERGVAVRAEACAWEDLPSRPWASGFDAVLCVGNALTHAAGRDGRRAALAAMAGALRAGGMLVVTSRNWERLRAARPGLEVADRLVERPGGAGLVVRAWTIPDGWDEPHALEVAVAIAGEDGSVRTRGERLAFWPFTRAALDADLRASGLTPATSTYAPDAERYAVTAIAERARG
jgi:SAM-dependent methyltransferase